MLELGLNFFIKKFKSLKNKIQKIRIIRLSPYNFIWNVHMDVWNTLYCFRNNSGFFNGELLSGFISKYDNNDNSILFIIFNC